MTGLDKLKDKWLAVKLDLFQFAVQSSHYITESTKESVLQQLQQIVQQLNNEEVKQ